MKILVFKNVYMGGKILDKSKKVIVVEGYISVYLQGRDWGES